MRQGFPCHLANGVKMSRQGERISEFDGIKGLAIIAIMLVHLCSWGGVSAMSDSVNRIAGLGAYGVEITYVLNAVLLAASFRKWGGACGRFTCKSILGIVPIYYLALSAHLLAERYFRGQISHSTVSVLLHFSFLQGFFPQYWDAFGLGYMGVLFIMWALYPLYMKIIPDWKTSLFVGISTCIFAGTCYYTLILHSPLVETQRWYTWLYYVLRGVYSYCIGNMVFHARSEMPSASVPVKGRVFFLIVSLTYLVLNVAVYKVSHLTFAILTGVLIWLVPFRLSKILAFPILVAAGEHIFELYMAHVSLYYVLVVYAKLLNSPAEIIIGISLLSLIVAPILKRFYSDPLRARLVPLVRR